MALVLRTPARIKWPDSEHGATPARCLAVSGVIAEMFAGMFFCAHQQSALPSASHCTLVTQTGVIYQ